MGRAEDQAYLFSTLNQSGSRLVCAHKDGLIMRHDKESFAEDALKAAYVGKLVGDYVRIVHFSAYAKVLSCDIDRVKRIVDPFTGCFVSRIPTSVVYLRFGLKAASFFSAGEADQGLEFIQTGAHRLTRAFEFVRGKNSPLKQQYERERSGWDLYYEILCHAESSLKKNDLFTLKLRRKAQSIVNQCCLHPTS
jgi:hypothetical protein